MIVTIVNCAQPDTGTVVAENLVLLRARARHKALLLDAGPGQHCQQWGVKRAHARLKPALAVQALRGPGCSVALERLRVEFDDVVIATDACDDRDCRWALIAAQVAVVPLAFGHADIDTDYACIARLNSARMFNPGLQVLFVAMAGEHARSPTGMDALRAYAAQVMSASLARTVLHLPALSWGADGPGRCVCDTESSTGAAEMVALYGEVYRIAPQVRHGGESSAPA